MQLYFDHIAGQAEKRELVYAPATAIFEKSEYEYALRTGWQVISSWGDGQFEWFEKHKSAGTRVWYQSRTSRLTPDEYVEKKRHRQRIRKAAGLRYEIHSQYDIETMRSIYVDYLRSRGFTDLYGEDHPFSSSPYGGERMIIVYYLMDSPVAFSIIDIVGSSGVATQFCWNYEMPNLQLGKISYYIEQQEAKKRGLKHIYLGSSYEDGSKSKCNYAGFEWWTGRIWSRDLELYKELATNETKMKTLEDLYQQQQLFYSKLDI